MSLPGSRRIDYVALGERMHGNIGKYRNSRKHSSALRLWFLRGGDVRGLDENASEYLGKTNRWNGEIAFTNGTGWRSPGFWTGGEVSRTYRDYLFLRKDIGDAITSAHRGTKKRRGKGDKGRREKNVRWNQKRKRQLRIQRIDRIALDRGVMDLRIAEMQVQRGPFRSWLHFPLARTEASGKRMDYGTMGRWDGRKRTEARWQK